MHRSRLAGFIIDCQNATLDKAAEFWGGALGMARRGGYDGYEPLDSSALQLNIEVQSVSHESRVHLDIESDDVEAEVTRLEGLGARRLEKVKTWVVMAAPTGQRFCVVRGKEMDGKPGVNVWP